MAPARRALLAALEAPERVQRERLAAILADHAGSRPGRRYGFAGIRDEGSYRRKVPVHDYDALRADIDASADGDSAALGAPVALFEETGGTSRGAKLIPYTAASLDGFRNALHAWLGDLLTTRPGIARGRAYWSISPAARTPRRTAGGTPVGMGDDARYFGDALAPRVHETLAVPAAVGAVADVDAWRYLTLRYLLAADDLSFVSVWSPTFLTELIARAPALAEPLCRDIADGTVSPHATASAGGALPACPPDPDRARIVARALGAARPDTRKLWPRLDTISCWTEGSAAPWVAPLVALFPHVHVQGKGLVATEGIVTLPLGAGPGATLAITSGFFEFRDAGGDTRLCTELREGETCEVVLTVPGLYRYALGDRVQVTGWYGRTPRLAFLGRGDRVSDLCGEKLDEAFVLRHLARVDGFTLVAPAPGDTPGYVLYVDAACHGAADAPALARAVEAGLDTNPAYRHARRLGQLAALVVRPVRDPLRRFLAHEQARGHVLGDVKPPALSTDADWAQRFAVTERAGTGVPA